MGSMFERDYIRRMIQQLAAFMARALRLRQEGRPDEALLTVEEAYRLVLGPDRLWLRDLDPASVARILGDSEHVKAYARLLCEEGELVAMQFNADRAVEAFQRARDLYYEALCMCEGKDSESAAALEYLNEQLNALEVGPGDATS